MRNIKEKHCYVESDDKKFDNEFGGVSKYKLAKDKGMGLGASTRKLESAAGAGVDLGETSSQNDYQLPDGTRIQLF